MMADTKRGAHPFAPLVLDDAGSLEDIAFSMFSRIASYAA